RAALPHPRSPLDLAGTGPRGGESSRDTKYLEYAASTDPRTGESGLEGFLYLFFRPTETSQAAGKAFLGRRHRRKKNVDLPSSLQTMVAQRKAITEWRQVRGERFSELKGISQPTVVVNGNHDVMIPTINSYNLSQNIPRAQLIIYPDSGHGAIFQFSELFVAHARLFLDGSVLRIGLGSQRRCAIAALDFGLVGANSASVLNS